MNKNMSSKYKYSTVRCSRLHIIYSNFLCLEHISNFIYLSDLSKNRFCELPEEVLAFRFLEKLNCYHNAIRTIPDTVNSLQCLNVLDLSRNQLTSLPRELCLLPIQVCILKI